jgi:hypothetical protein
MNDLQLAARGDAAAAVRRLGLQMKATFCSLVKNEGKVLLTV